MVLFGLLLHGYFSTPVVLDVCYVDPKGSKPQWICAYISVMFVLDFLFKQIPGIF
jgi:hypothetical protein